MVILLSYMYSRYCSTDLTLGFNRLSHPKSRCFIFCTNLLSLYPAQLGHIMSHLNFGSKIHVGIFIVETLKNRSPMGDIAPNLSNLFLIINLKTTRIVSIAIVVIQNIRCDYHLHSIPFVMIFSNF